MVRSMKSAHLRKRSSCIICSPCIWCRRVAGQFRRSAHVFITPAFTSASPTLSSSTSAIQRFARPCAFVLPGSSLNAASISANKSTRVCHDDDKSCSNRSRRFSTSRAQAPFAEILLAGGCRSLCDELENCVEVKLGDSLLHAWGPVLAIHPGSRRVGLKLGVALASPNGEFQPAVGKSLGLVGPSS